MSNFKWKTFSNFVAFSEYPNFTMSQENLKKSRTAKKTEKAFIPHTLCESGRRYQSQYRFINPFESDPNNFPKSISIIILRPHRRPFEEIDIENEAFAL